MKTTFSSKRRYDVAKVGIFLVVAILVGSMVGCIRLPPRPPVEIWDWYDLHSVRDNLSRSYVLMNDLDSTCLLYTSDAADE